MTKNKKKSVLIITVIALVALLAVGATLALLTDNGTIANILGIGRDANSEKLVKIWLVEDEYVKQINTARQAAYDQALADGKTVAEAEAYRDGAGLVTSSKSDPDDPTRDVVEKAALYRILPGSTIAKDPQIITKGDGPVYLRMRVFTKDATSKFTVDAFAANTLLTQGTPDGLGGFKPAGLGLTPDTNWYKGADGWYYYRVTGDTATTGTAVHGKDKNIDVFKVDGSRVSMTVPVAWTNADVDKLTADAKNLELQVQVQSTQAQNFTPDITSADPWAAAASSFVYSATID